MVYENLINGSISGITDMSIIETAHHSNYTHIWIIWIKKDDDYTKSAMRKQDMSNTRHHTLRTSIYGEKMK